MEYAKVNGTVISTTVVFQLGAQAARCGLITTSNPFPKRSHCAQIWAAGWDDADNRDNALSGDPDDYPLIEDIKT